jgi:hypothetical protein
MHSVHYSSTRREVWRHYWRSWARPTGLWRVHVMLGLVVAAVLTGVSGTSAFTLSRFVTTAATTTLTFVVLFPLWSRVRFKPAERRLIIDQDGWKTTIGKISGERAWKEVRSIEDARGAVVITGINGNALIVPERAFANEVARQEFLAAARNWHSSAAA